MRVYDEYYTENLFFLLLDFARKTRAALGRRLAEIGISIPEYAALMVLNSAGPLSNASLARECSISPQAMIKVRGQLMRAELICRVPSEQQREHLLAITPDGERKVDEIVICMKQTARDFATATSPEEYREFKRLLAIYWRAMDPSRKDDEAPQTDTMDIAQA